jgi:hypothetical protein
VTHRDQLRRVRVPVRVKHPQCVCVSWRCVCVGVVLAGRGSVCCLCGCVACMHPPLSARLVCTHVRLLGTWWAVTHAPAVRACVCIAVCHSVVVSLARVAQVNPAPAACRHGKRFFPWCQHAPRRRMWHAPRRGQQAVCSSKGPAPLTAWHCCMCAFSPDTTPTSCSRGGGGARRDHVARQHSSHGCVCRGSGEAIVH